MENKPVDLLVAICAHREISTPTAHSLDNLRNTPLPFTWTLGLFSGDALITRSRSMATTSFLQFDPPVPYMLFIDSDILFEPIHVQKIYQHLASGYDLIGGVYPVRGATQMSSYGWGGQLPSEDQIVDIEYLATGFMGISRRILEKIRDQLNLPVLNPNDWSRCYPFFEDGRTYTQDALKPLAKTLGVSHKLVLQIVRQLGIRCREKGDNLFISEDWDFCDKVRQVGGRVFADTSVQLGHLREQVFTPTDVKNVQYQSIMKAQVYGSLETQNQLMQKVQEDLSEFLGIPLKVVQNRFTQAQGNLAEMWKKHQGNAEDFYIGNEEYLFDLAWFNQQPHYFQDRIIQLVNISKKKVLDIGCGIGTTVFVMAQQGCEVIGWDINEKCIEFCNFKKKKYNLGGEFTTEKPDFSEFDLIIAVDVLEHISNLQEFLLELGKGMKFGAKFYHSDYFPRDKMWPMHFEENAEHLDDWLKQGGLIPWDGRWAIKG